MENAACYAPQILVSTEGLPREQWLEYRRKGIGGSDAAAVLGISPFRTGRDLYYDKLNTVIIPLLAAHNVLLTRNLLYTAITRAKRRVLLVGEKRALYMAIHRSRKGKRNTMLGERIALYYKAVTRKALRSEEGEEWQRAS